MKVGIAGAGWAGGVHAAALHGVSGAHLAQVVSRTAASAADLAASSQAASGTYAELDRRLDMLILATPAEHHAEMLQAALEAGLATLVEKPLGVSLAEADAMIADAEASELTCGYAENLLFAPAFGVLATHRESLGPLSRLHSSFQSEAPSWGHFLEPMPSGGVLADLGAHPIALVLALAGEEPTSVVGRVTHRRTDSTDDEASCDITFTSGLVATVEVSWRAAVTHWETELASASGAGRIDWFETPTVTCNGEDVTPAKRGSDGIDPFLEAFGYIAEVQGFVNALQGRGGSVCPLGFGRRVLQVVVAAYASAANSSEPVSV